MSDNNSIAEVSLPPVKVPAVLKEMLDGLKFLTLKGEKIRLFTMTDVMREALLKGVRLMTIEKEIYQVMIEEEAKNGAERIYTSLKERVENAQVKARTREALGQTELKRMEEETTTEEEVKEEEETKEEPKESEEKED